MINICFERCTLQKLQRKDRVLRPISDLNCETYCSSNPTADAGWELVYQAPARHSRGSCGATNSEAWQRILFDSNLQIHALRPFHSLVTNDRKSRRSLARNFAKYASVR